MNELQAIVRALAGEAPGRVLATLVDVQGSSYRRPGARLLVLADGTRVGSISGGCLEEDVLLRARRIAASGEAETAVYDTTSENDLVWGVGLGCHGVVKVLLERLPARCEWARQLAANFGARRVTRLAVRHGGGEPPGTTLGNEAAAATADVFVDVIAPPTALCVFGAGDDARPLVSMAKELGWHVTVADPRSAFTTTERFPRADALLVGAPEELVAGAGLDAGSLAVVMTHRYVHDLPLLRELLDQPLAYLGLLGPKKRAERLLDEVGAGPGQRARLHAPVGLDIGADGPEQVALAILAEMHAVLAGRDARPLRERDQPIHDVTAPSPRPPAQSQ